MTDFFLKIYKGHFLTTTFLNHQKGEMIFLILLKFKKITSRQAIVKIRKIIRYIKYEC